MPPQVGNIDRVAWSDLCHERRVERVAVAGEALEVRFVQRDHADRYARRHDIEWAKIKVASLLWREKHESPPSGDYTSEVVGGVEMRRDRDVVPDPQAARHAFRRQRVRIGFLQPGQDFGRLNGLYCDAQRLLRSAELE